MQDDRHSQIATPNPKAEDVLSDWRWCVEEREASAWAQIEQNVHARLAYWPGQTVDGRKWWRRKEEDDVFPWPGAADSRVHMVDGLVNEDVSLLMSALRRAKIVGLPTEVNDSVRAGQVTTLMRWQFFSQLRELKPEARLLANYLLERGAAVLSNIWVRQEQMGYSRITMDSIAQMAYGAETAVKQGSAEDLVPGVGNEELAQLPSAIMDPSRADEAIAVARVIWTQASDKAIRKALKELRDTGEGSVPIPYIVKDRPGITALALNEDVFLPPEATGIDLELSSLHWRELVTEATLKERVRGRKWDAEWVEAMIENQRGVVTPGLEGEVNSFVRRNAVNGRLPVKTDRLFEIIHSYRRLLNEDGVPGIYCTVWNHGMVAGKNSDRDGQWYGHHQLVNYDHGEYPFVLFQRERRSRNIDESRGYGQVASTWQHAVKSEWDGRRDRSSITTLPPSHHPTSAPPAEWGPGAQIGTNQPERYGFFKGPMWDPGSKEIEQTVLAHADRYFGRVLESGANKIEANNQKQDLVSNWLEGWEQVLNQQLQLNQQFMPDEVFARVIGDSKSAPIRITREEIQGRYDVQASFSIEDMDPDARKEKFQLIAEAIKIDRDAAIDTTAAIQMAFESTDPNMPTRLLRSSQESQQAETDDEEAVWSKLWAGIPVDVKPGQNYALRLQWLQNQIFGNPAGQEKYRSDQTFRTLVDRRIKQLGFQLQQYGENARIGRTGA